MATEMDKLTAVKTSNNGSKASVEENPKTTFDSKDLNQNATAMAASATVTVSSTTAGIKKENDDSKTAVAVVTSSADGAPTTDTQKKIRRAERFGMPVQLSEQEKRNSRAERFGTVSKTHGSEGSKGSEEMKRKARAERFGLPVPALASDEEAKKKARLARFAQDSKTDSLEEEKRKARALRFAGSPSNSISQVNGQGNIEPKAAIAGKAGGGT